MEYPTSHLYFLGIHTSHWGSVYTKKIQVGYSIVYHEKVLCNYFIPCHKFGRLLNLVENTVAAHDGKVAFNTVEYTTAFLYSDWLYFLWHGINANIHVE